MEVLVFGAGSLGSLVGGLLAREHAVTLVGRDPHVSAVRETGLRIGGEIEAVAEPEAATTTPDGRFDLAVVTVKAYDTRRAARELATAEIGAALSLQNGLGNERVLAEHLIPPVLSGTCTYGARLAEPGRVRCTGRGEITLGARTGGESRVAGEVGAAFREAGVETAVATDMPRRLWEKLAINAGINAVTALARVENGALVDGPATDTACRAAREAAAVAREQGFNLDGDEVASAVRAVADATAANASSMLQDVREGTSTEIDAINGYVVDRADGPAPVNETLTALVRTWERERGLR